MSSLQQVPVVIVGAGPVGVTLANLLGHHGVQTLVIDKNASILDFPRAVGLDDEALRTLQACGLAEELLQNMIQNVPMRMYTGARRCFAEILPSTREFGWFRRNLFSQPLAEVALRRGLARYPHVRLACATELIGLKQDAHGVDLTLRGPDGAIQAVRALYVVGADGGRSRVRETELEVPFEGRTHSHKWVVIECEDDPLEAPYTALHCDPRRPHVCLRLPYGLRRWEFMLFPGEDGEQMLEPAKVHELLRGHVEDPERLNIIRARVYTHNSRVARSFAVGRVCLAGDAAHITPPWIGQGLNAGMRDAFNLAWKLAWIIDGRMKPELLESYHQERHAHAKAMIALADLFGAVLSQRNRVVAWLRDRFFLAIRGLPGVRDYVLQMKFKPMPRFSAGIVFDGGDRARNELVGRMFIQPDVEIDKGRSCKLDEALGSGFALLSWRCDPLADAPAELLHAIEDIDCVRLVGVRARSSASEIRAAAGDRPDACVAQDVENALHFWFQAARVDWVLIRPDRFVAAVGLRADACEQLALVVQRLRPARGAASRIPVPTAALAV